MIDTDLLQFCIGTHYLPFTEHRPTKEMRDDHLAELAPWSEKLQSIKNRM